MTDARKDPPFRADHVGSLLRPRALREAFRAHHDGSLPESGFHAVQDEAVRGAIALQEEAGLQAITDGEFRRPSYWARFVERVEGLAVGEALFRFRDADGIETSFTAPHVVAPVRRTGSIAGDEFQFLRANTERTPKITLPPEIWSSVAAYLARSTGLWYGSTRTDVPSSTLRVVAAR